MIEAQILHVLLKRRVWIDYSGVLDWYSLKLQTPDVHKVMLAIKQWHETKTDDLAVQELPIWFNLQYPGLSDKQKELYGEIIEQAKTADVRDDLAVQYLQQLKDTQTRRTIAVSCMDDKIKNDKIIELVSGLNIKEEPENIVEEEFVTTDIDLLSQEASENTGLFWRLSCLNKSIGPISKGVLGGVIGRKETGKTAFWVSEIANFLPQMKDDEHAVIFFNEEQGMAVMWRLYSAITEMPYVDILNNKKKARELFFSAGGNRLKFKDAPTHNEEGIRKTLDTLHPAIIVIDSFDKIKGFKADRKDLELGAAYKFGREVAKTYAPVIAISQADAGGFNKKYLTELDMADSKTAKPAELDFLIGLGRTDDAGYEYVRYINISVNKLPSSQYKEEKDRHGRFQTIIVPELSLYRD